MEMSMETTSPALRATSPCEGEALSGAAKETESKAAPHQSAAPTASPQGKPSNAIKPASSDLKQNMDIYNAVKSVPDSAKKTISGGRMNGKTDISPMWRILKLTELFGPCGIGWWYVIKDQRLEAGANGEIKAFVDIDLYYKLDDTVSQPIPGIGGNSFVAKESGNFYTSDECFKMALTDAISVAAKALGVGADVYMGGDRTKYSGDRSEGEGRSYNYLGRRDNPKGNAYPPAPNERYARPQGMQPPSPKTHEAMGRGAEQPPYRQAASGSTLPPHGEANEGAEHNPPAGAKTKPQPNEVGAVLRGRTMEHSAVFATLGGNETVRDCSDDKPVLAADGYYYCTDCGEIIRNQRGKDGSLISAAEVAALALKLHKKQLCAECLKKREVVE